MKMIINCKLKNTQTKTSVNYKNNLLYNKKSISKKQTTIPAESQQAIRKTAKINDKISIIRTRLNNKPKAVYESAGLRDLGYIYDEAVSYTDKAVLTN